MKQGKNCDISGGQCKSGLELASSAKGSQSKICDIIGSGLGWMLGGLAELGGGDKLEGVDGANYQLIEQ